MKKEKSLIYTPDMTGVEIIKEGDDRWEDFFWGGHPYFLIPDFGEKPDDICISYEDYIEKIYEDIYDQNGGEIITKKTISNDGKILVEYTLYDISLVSTPDDFKEYTIFIEGYVVEKNDELFFMATKVTGDL